MATHVASGTILGHVASDRQLVNTNEFVIKLSSNVFN